MQDKPKIILQQERDFGQKITAAFEFIRQELVPLFKGMLFIAGPFILIAGLGYGYLQTAMFSSAFTDPIDSDDLVGFYSYFTLPYLFLLLSTVAVTTVVNDYIVLYREQAGPITVDALLARVKSDYLKVLVTTVIVIMIVLFSMIFFVLPAIYLGVVTSLIFIIQLNEKVSFGEAFSRCFKLIGGKWWSTFGLIFVMALLQGIVSSAFSLPMMIMLFLRGLHITEDPSQLSQFTPLEEIFYIGSYTVTLIVSQMLYALIIVAVAFQYFNLVERKEASGLISKIDQMGNGNSKQPE